MTIFLGVKFMPNVFSFNFFLLPFTFFPFLNSFFFLFFSFSLSFLCVCVCVCVCGVFVCVCMLIDYYVTAT